MVAEGLTVRTVNTYLSLLGTILNAAVDDDHLARSPLLRKSGAGRTAATRNQPVPREVWLLREQLDRLADAILPRYRALGLVAALTGMRWGELVALRWNDPRFDQPLDDGAVRGPGRLRIARAISDPRRTGRGVEKGPKTEAGRRVIALDREAGGRRRRAGCHWPEAPSRGKELAMARRVVTPDAGAPTTSEATTNSTRRLLACGIVAGPLFLVVALVQALTRDGFDLSRHPISLLSLGELGWIQIANFIVTGGLYVACAAGMRRVLRHGRGATWGPRLVGALGVGLIMGGVFVTDPGAGFPPGAPAGAPSRSAGTACCTTSPPPWRWTG